MRALVDLEAIAAVLPNEANYRSIGLFRYYLGQFPESAAALAQAKPEDRYAAIWRYLAQMRAGQAKDARSALVEGSKTLTPGKWPAAVVNLYLGKATEPTMFAAAKHADPKTQADQVCEANFYAGALKLARNQQAQALPLRAAEKGCPRDFVEYQGAVAELGRLRM